MNGAPYSQSSDIKLNGDSKLPYHEFNNALLPIRSQQINVNELYKNIIFLSNDILVDTRCPLNIQLICDLAVIILV